MRVASVALGDPSERCNPDESCRCCIQTRSCISYESYGCCIQARVATQTTVAIRVTGAAIQIRVVRCCIQMRVASYTR